MKVVIESKPVPLPIPPAAPIDGSLAGRIGLSKSMLRLGGQRVWVWNTYKTSLLQISLSQYSGAAMPWIKCLNVLQKAKKGFFQHQRSL